MSYIFTDIAVLGSLMIAIALLGTAAIYCFVRGVLLLRQALLARHTQNDEKREVFEIAMAYALASDLERLQAIPKRLPMRAQSLEQKREQSLQECK